MKSKQRKKDRVLTMLQAGYSVEEIAERGAASKSYIYAVAAADKQQREIAEIYRLALDIKAELKALIGAPDELPVLPPFRPTKPS